ncbi:hypothetical protein H5410_065092 [Solanum commersonii]|uniref:Uncharacterized protein n=1 Tax=Solanum commersonii TaxID=4109 RepID=A0A9J5VXU5_SOLCO|nr:hypothetical protein H5410_065092 [Solanum commersonii]
MVDEKRSQTKSIYGQELDLILKPYCDYKTIPNKGIMIDDSTSRSQEEDSSKYKSLLNRFFIVVKQVKICLASTI